jgi:protein-tyrosine phosphatase
VFEQTRADGPFTILVVCTGNICRSPLAAQLLETRLSEAGIEAVVHSAGTGALVDRSMTEQAAELSARYRAASADHRARQLTTPMVREADLVLTAARTHRAEVVSELPRAARYTFTLNQFARIAESLTPEEVAAATSPLDLVDAVAVNRGLAPPPETPDDDDIVDPFRQSQEVYDVAGAAIDRAVSAIVDALARTRG